MKYWINTISKEHVLLGVKAGFTQANHGSGRNIKQLSKGDPILFYSAKKSFTDSEPYQKITACGVVIDNEPYRFAMTDSFHPWRRNLRFVTMQETSIKPMIGELGFIRDPKHWGFPFMRGLFEISKEDFELIATAVGVKMSSLTL